MASIQVTDKKGSRTKSNATKFIAQESLPKGRYINPLTDFGFKRIFGEENMELLINFLNSVLDMEDKIVSLQYKNVEQKGRTKKGRGAFFDLRCTTDKDSDIIIEVQNVPQPYFKDRVLYYTTFPIQKQSKRGAWNYRLNHLYSINILNFKFNEDDDYIHYVRLMDVKRKEVFYDKLDLIFIELPVFNKPENDLKTFEEWWCYVLKNLSDLKKIPDALRGNQIFKRLFDEAELANMTPEELELYDKSLKYYREDMYTTKDIIKDYVELNTELSNRNATLSNKVTTLSNQNTTLSGKVTTLSNQVAEKDNRIAELERKLGLN